MLRILNTVLCLGLNLVIERLGLDPRWKWAVLALVVTNEARGGYVAYEGFTALIAWWWA